MRICYFFFKDNYEQNNLATALCSVLHQLFSQQSHLLQHAIPAWEKNGWTLRQEVDELWRILIAATSADISCKTICIFDALDECCETDQRRLIEKLQEFHRQPSSSTEETCLKFLVTSRPYDHIQDHFRAITVSFPHIHIKGEEQNDQIHEEIDQVARIRVRELAETVPLSPELHHRLEQQLLQMEHRTYLWLHLAIDDIRTTFKDSLRPAEDWITLIPPSVNAAYENILCRVPAGLIDRVKKILEIIVAARRPLTIKEMAMALGIATSSASPTTKQDGLDPIGLDGKLRRWCGLFVFTNNSKIYLIHQTAREYLIEKKNFSNLKSAYWSSLTDAEDQMAEICLTYLLMENLEYDEDDSGSHARSFLEYSAAHWPDHVRKMSLTSTQKETYRVHRLYDISGKPFLMWYPIFWKAIRPYERTPVMSALHLAAFNGHEQEVHSILGVDESDVNTADDTTTYPVMWASLNGHDRIVELLLERGADANAQGGRYGNALQAACYEGHDKIAQILLEREADFNTQGGFYGNALQAACFRGHDKIAQILLERGADANAEGGEYGNALQAACSEGRDNIARILLEKGANINAEGGEYGNALQAACFKGRDKIARILLEQGANVNAEGGFFGNALQAACFEGRDKIARILLEKGANVNAEGRFFGNALQAACFEGRDKIATNGKLEIVRLLLDNGADISVADNNGCTPLYSASSNGHLGVVRLLLDNGADIILADKRACTPLHGASENGHVEVVKLLLQSLEASIDTRDDTGRTPLFLAAARGRSEVLRLLLSCNALANVNDRYNATPLCAAIRNGHREAVELLLPLTESTVVFEDGLGRTLAWWASKSGCVKIIDLVHQLAQRMDIEVCKRDLTMACSLDPFDRSSRSCDVCTRFFSSDCSYYHCEACHDDFDVCLECYECDIHCFDASHDWILCDPDSST